MKIGILTHHYISNYGAFLQAYALQEYLRKTYPSAEVRMINYINRRHYLINTGGFFRFYPGTETPAGWLDKTRQPRMFRKMQKEKLCLTKEVATAEQVAAMGFDLIFIGSDEVWNYEDAKSYDPIKFGCGLTGGKLKLAAYAPSVRRVSEFSHIPPEAVEGIRSAFSAISVRDENTGKLVAAAGGGEAVQVLDPTFLDRLPARRSERVEKLTSAPYILFYHCDGMEASEYQKITEDAHKHGLIVLGAGENCRYFDANTASLDPFEWMALFEHAQIVYTGTFHGTVFSILNRRQIRFHISIESRRQKIRMLTELLGIDVASGYIDYDKVYEKIGQLQKVSRDYIDHAVSLPNEAD